MFLVGIVKGSVLKLSKEYLIVLQLIQCNSLIIVPVNKI